MKQNLTRQTGRKALALSILTATMLTAGVALAVAEAPAPSGPPPGNGAPQGSQGNPNDARFLEINKATHLTAEQQVKVRAILDQSMAELDQQRKQYPTWNDQAKAAIDQLWVTERNRILAVLSETQKPKYTAYQDAWLAERSKDKH